MKESRQPNPAGRLADLRIEDDPIGVGILLRSVVSIDSSTPAARQSVKWRIRETLRQRDRTAVRFLRPILAAALVFASGGVLGAAIQRIAVQAVATHGTTLEPGEGRERNPRKTSTGRSLATANPHQVTPRAEESAAVAGSSPVTSAGGPSTEPIASPSAHGGSRGKAKDVAPVATKPVSGRTVPSLDDEPSSGVPDVARPAEEHAMLARAIRFLRTEGRAAEALAVIDDYQIRFAGGSLAPEEAALRAETLLKMGRNVEALGVLDGLLERPLPANDERRVLRGELRAVMGSWRGALSDFDLVLTETDGTRVRRPRAGLVERALWGRAGVRTRLGDDPGARADLVEYLRRFPHGPFAVQASRSLEQRP